ncbi:hypothetical protein B9J07_27780 [Sinorhizobium sp. LM21]|uniref:hypothetical protein n=1 Tax=Sinorhizobium sp. LM21 TaxID=1449788 RepID=UPI0005D9730E|nr:hypothetical protein [Sinorhizobium sp. LM21]AJW30206.1 hypothetical protein pLM21S1_p86 [Sinorhizobium sp. LM21]OWZ90390.1 hypothetical protein B9J07_27780 [Sinorhizobium sp. LM21]
MTKATLFAHHLTEMVLEALAGGSHRLRNASADIAWTFGERRLGDACRDRVLTIEHFVLHRGVSGALRHFALNLVCNEPASPVKIDFIHFLAPDPYEIRVLRDIHFNRYQIGDRLDYWHAVTFQRELI